MIIQNSSMNQGTQTVRLVSNDAPNVVARTTEPVTPQQPSPEQLKVAVNNINQAMRQSKQNLEFSVDTTTKKPVVRMVDTDTGELIRQFPSDAVLAIASSIDQFLLQHQFQQGLLLNQKG
jgi:flagellar protein FlaG